MDILRIKGMLSGCLGAACIFMLCHCAVRPPGVGQIHDDSQQDHARKLLQNILSVNDGLETLKGRGSVNLKQKDQSYAFDVAWMGKRPDCFRLEVLAVTGQPMMSFAGNGQRHYFLSYSDSRLYSRRASRETLKQMTSIALTPEELLDLLSGRLPVHPESRAWIEDSGEDSPIVLTLENPKKRYHDRIVFSDDEPSIFHEMERRDRRGKLLFRAEIKDTMEDGAFLIPTAVIISNEDGGMVHIIIEKYWKNQDIPDDRFVLQAQ